MISADLNNIADTLEARDKTRMPLAPAECAALAAHLRSLADRVEQMEQQPVPEHLVRLKPALTLVRGGRV